MALMNMVVFQARRYAFFAWLVLVIAVIIGFAKLSTLASENRNRIADIQESRIETCHSIYQSFHVIFDPLTPPPGKRTRKQQRNIERFNKLIDKKTRECRALVTPPSPK